MRVCISLKLKPSLLSFTAELLEGGICTQLPLLTSPHTVFWLLPPAPISACSPSGPEHLLAFSDSRPSSVLISPALLAGQPGLGVTAHPWLSPFLSSYSFSHACSLLSLAAHPSAVPPCAPHLLPQLNPSLYSDGLQPPSQAQRSARVSDLAI